MSLFKYVSRLQRMDQLIRQTRTGTAQKLDISSKLLQKIEELTLYVIEQEKRIKALEAENEAVQHPKK